MLSPIFGFLFFNEVTSFPTIVGEQNIKALAEVISHESGHTLGLQHQSSYDESCNLTSVYNGGTGNGETAWAPIMGTGNERNFSLWNYGPTQKGCGQKQDNLYFITRMNGFDYRLDDHGDDLAHATNIALDAQQFSQSGIIATTQDVDIFQFNSRLKTASCVRSFLQRAATFCHIARRLEPGH